MAKWIVPAKLGGGERPVRIGSTRGVGVGGVREESCVDDVADVGGKFGRIG